MPLWGALGRCALDALCCVSHALGLDQLLGVDPFHPGVFFRIRSANHVGLLSVDQYALLVRDVAFDGILAVVAAGGRSQSKSPPGRSSAGGEGEGGSGGCGNGGEEEDGEGSEGTHFISFLIGEALRLRCVYKEKDVGRGKVTLRNGAVFDREVL